MQSKLKLIRQAFDLKLNDFADLTGVTRQTVYNIENNRTELTQMHYLASCQVIRTLLNKYPDKYSLIKNIWESDYDTTFEDAMTGLSSETKKNCQ